MQESYVLGGPPVHDSPRPTGLAHRTAADPGEGAHEGLPPNSDVIPFGGGNMPFRPERWLSGRKRGFAKSVTGKLVRRFESCPLRSYPRRRRNMLYDNVLRRRFLARGISVLLVGRTRPTDRIAHLTSWKLILRGSAAQQELTGSQPVVDSLRSSQTCPGQTRLRSIPTDRRVARAWGR
jgi:hypothetical protein